MEITTALISGVAGISTRLMPDLAKHMTVLLPRYGIDEPREVAHFLAQACHETDHFRTLREYASGAAYEGRKDLGNTQPGDGARFRGRGIFQTTGRNNYRILGVKKGDPAYYTRNPEYLERPEDAVWSACEYWDDHNFNDVAGLPASASVRLKLRGVVKTVPPIEYISVRINGGYNGFEKRKQLYARACSLLKVRP